MSLAASQRRQLRGEPQRRLRGKTPPPWKSARKVCLGDSRLDVGTNQRAQLTAPQRDKCAWRCLEIYYWNVPPTEVRDTPGWNEYKLETLELGAAVPTPPP